MFKKVAVSILVLFMVLQSVSCTSKNNNKTDGIQFFKSFNESTGELSEPKEYINSGTEEYVAFDYGRPFNSSTIGMTVYQYSDGEKMGIYDIFMDIDPDSSIAVFPVEIYRAAEYEMVIYFEDPEDPIASKRFYVFD